MIASCACRAGRHDRSALAVSAPPSVRRLALSGTHLVVDIFGNIYAPLLPIFIQRLDLSLAAAGVLAMALQLAGSVAQLVFGQLADRWRPRVLAVTGPSWR